MTEKKVSVKKIVKAKTVKVKPVKTTIKMKTNKLFDTKKSPSPPRNASIRNNPLFDRQPALAPLRFINPLFMPQIHTNELFSKSPKSSTSQSKYYSAKSKSSSSSQSFHTAKTANSKKEKKT